MRFLLNYLIIRTRQTTERLDFSEGVTFLYGPVGTGKSTVARLIDYCLGGELERTPAIQHEFISATLSLVIGDYSCTLERGADDTLAVRATWTREADDDEDIGSVNAPLRPSATSLLDAEVYNLSDLLFHLGGVTPIKVRQRTRDPDSPLIRLGFRDIWLYCYLDQTHLDSSFFRLNDPFRGRKSQDAMRFFTGMHSERLSQLESDLYRTIDEQQGKREAVKQIRQFMDRFRLGSELDIAGQLQEVETELQQARARKADLERQRRAEVHPTDELRARLRQLGAQIADFRDAAAASEEAIEEQTALRAELITTKIKAERADQAGKVLEGVLYDRCPQCGIDVSTRQFDDDRCRLCNSPSSDNSHLSSMDLEAVRRELNDRIDQIADSIQRRKRVLERTQRQLSRLEDAKRDLDAQLEEELVRYDSAYIESIRVVEREVATLDERLRSLSRLQEMPQAISQLEEEAGALQGKIDRLRTDLQDERSRLRQADDNIAAISEKVHDLMVTVGFPGVSEDDEVTIDPRNWRPTVVHGDQEWSFWDAGSGGKKTMFNVIYALAIHEVARERGMPVPSLLIIDSPTKNISDDENPELVQAMYREIYRVATRSDGEHTQFLLIDSDLVEPETELASFSQRRMAGELDAPSLISYYDGP